MAEKKLKNEFYLRIKDVDLLEDFLALLDTKKYTNANELLNVCLAKSLPILYEEMFEKQIKKSKKNEKVDVDTENLDKSIAGVEKLLHQIFVKNFMIERLLSVLYNSEYYRSKGIKLEAQHFENRVLEELPEGLAEMEQELIKHLKYMENEDY